VLESRQLPKLRRLVVKVGSSLVTNHGAGLDRTAIASWASQIVQLVDAGIETVLVSSGAVAEGIQRLGWSRRPTTMHELQAAAAVGQMGLVEAYESAFRAHEFRTAQILLTHADLADRKRYLNARSTLRTLLSLRVIPIINENDTVVTDEIRFGDNDTLGALVTNLVEADCLIILTDKDGVFSADPGKSSNATLIRSALASDSALDTMAGASSSGLGRGGMITKIQAARRAARSGADTIIASGRVTDILPRLVRGDQIGTHLKAGTSPIAARKQWLADHVQIAGMVHVDAGAANAIQISGKSLLPIGVTKISGEFERGAIVSCINESGVEIARGLINYSAAESQLISRKPSDEIKDILGYVDEDELIHRDNLVLL
jgi:glutamate 5-kinase